jgi:Major Facilitator Superfamily
VANMYYAQPLLPTLASAFGVSEAAAGLLITVTQIGYVAGLASLVPLGDLLERRRLITTTLLVTAVAQAVAAGSPGFAVFAIAITAVGVTSVVAQVIVPMSSLLAAEHERGSVVGTVMSGLLAGRHSPRPHPERCRGGTARMARGLRIRFRSDAAAAGDPAACTPHRARERDTALPGPAELGPEPGAGRAAAAPEDGARRGGVRFSMLWTSLAFLLSGAPYHYGNAVIGLFGLAGLAGALIAPVAGRLADRGRGRLATTGAIAVLIASWGLLALDVAGSG